MNCRNCSKSLAKRKRNKEYYEISKDPAEYECVKCYNRRKSRDRVRITSNINDASDTLNSNSFQEENRGDLDDCAMQLDDTAMDNSNELKEIKIDIERSSIDHKKCIFGCKRDGPFTVLSKEECIEIYIKTDIFVPFTSRICSSHKRENNVIIPDYFRSISSSTSLNSDEITSLILTMKKMIVKERELRTKPPSFLAMESKQLFFETGLYHDSFNIILNYIVGHVKTHNNEIALGMYLSRIRRGYTFEELESRYNIKRQTISTYCEKIRNVLKHSFCQKYVSFAVDRQNILSNQNEVTQILHTKSPDKGTIIFDATYLRIEKSFNFQFQRKSWSVHKHSNLLKPMMAVYPNGRIAGVWGPYPGNTNDATILNKLLEKPIWSAFEEGDVFLVDRGFRDSVKQIEQRGFVAKMPSFADGPNKPLSTAQANYSRAVTRSRYIVEVVNGRINNNNQYFNKTVRNTTINTLFDDFKIACAIYNLTFIPVQSSHSDCIIAEKIVSLIEEENKVFNLISGLNLNMKTSIFQRIELVTLEVFLRLSIEDLKLYTCGTYQIKMCPFYYSDHLDENGDFEFKLSKHNLRIDYRCYNIDIDSQDAFLIQVHVRSRHSSRSKYFVYVLVDTRKTGLDSIIGHTCGCKVGRRVVGCCSHVCMILWFFGYARHLEQIPIAPNHSDVFLSDDDRDNDDNEIAA